MGSAVRSMHPAVGRRASSRRRLLLARSQAAGGEAAYDRAQTGTEGEAAGPVTAGTIPAGGLPVETVQPVDPVQPGTAGLAAISHLLRGAQPATWVFAGDSITQGALFTEGWRSFPEHFGERVRWELRRLHDVVINTGVCGETSRGLLAALDARILRFAPDATLLLIGMNDALQGPAGRAEFRENLEEIVGRLREGGTIPVLQTPNFVCRANSQTRSDLDAYVDVIREVAAETDVPLIDHWDHWQSRRPTPESLLAWLQDESIHPNFVGHREMSRTICHAFGVFDRNSMMCSLPVT